MTNPYWGADLEDGIPAGPRDDETPIDWPAKFARLAEMKAEVERQRDEARDASSIAAVELNKMRLEAKTWRGRTETACADRDEALHRRDVTSERLASAEAQHRTAIDAAHVRIEQLAFELAEEKRQRAEESTDMAILLKASIIKEREAKATQEMDAVAREDK